MTLSNANSTRVSTMNFPTGVRFRSVKINGNLIYSSADRPEDMYGDKKDDSIVDSLCGPFSFYINGKVCITDLVLA